MEKRSKSIYLPHSLFFFHFTDEASKKCLKPSVLGLAFLFFFVFFLKLSMCAPLFSFSQTYINAVCFYSWFSFPCLLCMPISVLLWVTSPFPWHSELGQENYGRGKMKTTAGRNMNNIQLAEMNKYTSSSVRFVLPRKEQTWEILHHVQFPLDFLPSYNLTNMATYFPSIITWQLGCFLPFFLPLQCILLNQTGLSRYLIRWQAMLSLLIEPYIPVLVLAYLIVRFGVMKYLRHLQLTNLASYTNTGYHYLSGLRILVLASLLARNVFMYYIQQLP